MWVGFAIGLIGGMLQGIYNTIQMRKMNEHHNSMMKKHNEELEKFRQQLRQRNF
jgi:uncharacterized membrane-anchored protein YhcB (DUF1043 family)